MQIRIYSDVHSTIFHFPLLRHLYCRILFSPGVPLMHRYYYILLQARCIMRARVYNINKFRPVRSGEFAQSSESPNPISTLWWSITQDGRGDEEIRRKFNCLEIQSERVARCRQGNDEHCNVRDVYIAAGIHPREIEKISVELSGTWKWG